MAVRLGGFGVALLGGWSPSNTNLQDGGDPGSGREGWVPLREAILELGKGLSDHHPEFKAYKRHKIAQGKKKTVAAVAVAHRAHRLAFAMIRGQTVFDPHQWDQSVMVGGSVTAAKDDRHDVTRPPAWEDAYRFKNELHL